MYRTDKEMLRRISGNNIQGSIAVVNKIPNWRKDESIAGWAKGQPWIMNKNDLIERALTLSYCDFLNKELEENEWFLWAEKLDHDFASDKTCLPDEWAFDEFVFSIKQTIDMQTVLNEKFGTRELVHSDTKEASMWCYINNTEPQREGLEYTNKKLKISGRTEGYEVSESMNSAYLSLFIKYDREPTIYYWDGWFLPMRKENLDSAWGVVPTPLTQQYWQERDNLIQKEYPKYESKPLITGLSEAASIVSLSVAKMMTYLKYGPKHLVEVHRGKPAKKRKGGLAAKRPWLNATGPKILLLDRMPSTQKEHQGGTHASPKPHRRRGHWKTLRHPKYRHHPKYQVENGVFIKPSFVGPKEAEYEGNIYKLVEPWPDEVA
tara:strand:- start:147 stop:1277 length:1131 start_codon:yes stop_codon:yes gene_type:complete